MTAPRGGWERRVHASSCGPRLAPRRHVEAQGIRQGDSGIAASGDGHLALDEALHKLASIHELHHAIVQLRYFAGLSIDEVAEVLEVSPSQVDRHWRFARAWLYRELGGDSAA